MRDPGKTDVVFLVLVVLLAFAVRALVNVVFQGLNGPPDPDFPDGVAYVQLAQSLASTGRYFLNGHLSLHFPPGIPFILAPTFWFGESSYVGARLVFSLLGALTCLPVYAIGRIISGRFTGRLAAVILALYPEHFYWSMHFCPEVPAGLLLAATIALGLKVDKTPSSRGYLLLGLLFGAQALVTPRMLLLFPVFWLLRFLGQFRHGLVRSAYPIAAAALGMLLAVAPWTFRNYEVSGKFVLISSHGGSTLLTGNNILVGRDPSSIGGWYQGRLSDIPGWEASENLPDQERSREATRLATAYLRSLTAREFVRLEVMKLYRFLTPVVASPNRVYRLVIGASWLLLCPFVLQGLWASRRSPSAYGLRAAILAYIVITLIFFGEPRYRAAISSVLVTYAALGVSALAGRGSDVLRYRPEVES